MIDQGANPKVEAYDGKSEYERQNLQALNLTLPPEKSIYFSVQKIDDDKNLADPWFYQSGVYKGFFDKKIGSGASGTVVRGKWNGKPAAFKFVPIGEQKGHTLVVDALATLNEKLVEMTSMESISGSKMVGFFGHYR